MVDAARIDELRRRLQKDPASMAFAQLAEEHRRAGDFDAAIRICRTGLAVRPTYLSARVTLGRALIEVGRLDEAAGELEAVLRAAPDNLAALRACEDIAARRRKQAGLRRPLAGDAMPADTRRIDSLAELERWLAAIIVDRDRRGAAPPAGC